jgi:hypothetical protein
LELDGGDVDGLRPFTGRFDLVLDRLAIFQAFITLAGDTGVVDEDFAAVVLDDESEALASVEPLDPARVPAGLVLPAGQ